MANVIQQKFGTLAPASDSLAKGELAIRFVAANHTASSSSKLYFGEGDSANLRQFGFGITDGSTQSGVAIGENLTFTGGNAISTSVSGNAVTINHDDTSSQSSVNNSGSTFIQDITIDTYGHITGITSADAGSGSGLSGLGSTDNAILRANGTGGDTAQGSGATITDDGILTVSKVSTGSLEDSGSTNGKFSFTSGFGSDDTIQVHVGGATRFAFVENSGTRAFIPWNDNDVNLGHSSYEFKNLYLDGTAFIDALQIGSTAITATGAELNILDGVTSTAAELNLLDGSSANTVVNSKAVIYGSSGELAGTLSTAAQANITSLGTLTTLTVDDITINGSTISDAGDFTIDVEGDITVDANGGQIYFKDNGTTYWTFDHGSNDIKLTTAGSNFEIENAGDFLVDAADDITLDAAGDHINFADAGSTRFTFNLDSTPELDVTGNFKIDGSGTIELDGTGGIKMTEGGDSTTTVTLRPTQLGAGQKAQLMTDKRIQYYHSSSASTTVNLSSSVTDNVYFLPALSNNEQMDTDDNIHHTFQAPCNGLLLAVIASSNNVLFKDEGPNSQFTAMQFFESNSSGNNVFNGSVANMGAGSGGGGSVVMGKDENGNDTVSEVTATRSSTDADVAEAVYKFADAGAFNIVGGKTYAFGFRITTLPAGQTSKSHALNLTYVISWDETTADSAFGGWSGY